VDKLMHFWPACCCGGIAVFAVALWLALGLCRAAAAADPGAYAIRDK